jgi:CDP-diacylglycerol--serine O-phosphatidyltransferase
MNWLVNILTGISLVSGLLSIIFSLELQFTFASWAIILSVLLDGLDGQIARRSPKQSDFGREFDSLADLISFGMAPAILSYIFVYRHFYLWATLALFLYLFCSVIRLAQFNITPKEKLVNYFYGLPTTISGGIIASFILIYRKYSQLPPPQIFLLIVLSLSYLMICQIRYLNLDGLRQVLGRKILLVLCVAIIVAIFFPEITILILLLVYLISSPFVVKLINSHSL